MNIQNDWYLNNSFHKYIVRLYSGAVNHDKETTMDRLTELRNYEREARRLRAEYAKDLTMRAVVACDLAIRRLAHRVLSQLAGVAHAGLTRTERGGYGSFRH